MRVIYLHFCWFLFIILIFFFSLFISVYLRFLSCRVYVSIPIFSIPGYSLVFSLYLDWISTWFITIILLISIVVAFYSYNYIAPYSKPIYFIVLTTMFVLSMLLVVLDIRLGWSWYCFFLFDCLLSKSKIYYFRYFHPSYKPSRW